MTDKETLKFRIELLEDQIHNLERSGFFTEKEMETLSKPMRVELIYSRAKYYGNMTEAEKELEINSGKKICLS